MALVIKSDFHKPQNRALSFLLIIMVILSVFVGGISDVFAQDLKQPTQQPTQQPNCKEGAEFHRAFWPNTDFSNCTASLLEIRSGGPGKDGIPAIDAPTFIPAGDEDSLAANEPVISIAINGEARAWPLRILTWHEIVNDNLGGVPIAVTYCPLCNAAVIFERKLDNQILNFGTTGNLRNSDLVMYDRQTESWWQQYTGEALFGSLAGQHLTMLPARLESWAQFLERHPEGSVLQPPQPIRRAYGNNPYVGYDTSRFPFLFSGQVPDNIAPLARVIVVDGKAWSLEFIQAQERFESDDFVISWRAGQNSALDTSRLEDGRDVGTITVQKRAESGVLIDAVHHVTFAFVFHAFNPETPITTL